MISLRHGLIALVLALLASSVESSAQNQPAAVDTSAVYASVLDSEGEARAMSAVIAAVRAQTVRPAIPADAMEKVAAARAAHAVTPAEFADLARDVGAAARAAPWVADYHFLRGGFLVKAGSFAAAARAFRLYLEAAPDARDRPEVLKLITSLRNRPAQGEGRPQVRAVGTQFRDCPACPEMVVLPAGRFVMGSPAQESGRFDSEGPQHAVSIRAFALGKYPVTQQEFIAFLAATGYQPAPCNRLLDKTWRSPGNGIVFPPGQADLPRQPAVCVNWNDVQVYIAWLNRTVGEGHYRLPSEAEWEYAARAGTKTARWWGEGLGTGNANCQGCGSAWDNALIAPVGSFNANAFGIYDVLGNTWEWLADCWNENYAGAPADGSAWVTGDCTRRVMRGGSWSNLPAFIRSAARSRGDAAGGDFDYSSYVGFRLAKSL